MKHANPNTARMHQGRDVNSLQKKPYQDAPRVIYLSRNTKTAKDYGATDIYSRIVHGRCRFRCVSADSSQQRKGRLCPDKWSDVKEEDKGDGSSEENDNERVHKDVWCSLKKKK